MFDKGVNNTQWGKGGLINGIVKIVYPNATEWNWISALHTWAKLTQNGLNI